MRRECEYMKDSGKGGQVLLFFTNSKGQRSTMCFLNQGWILTVHPFNYWNSALSKNTKLTFDL